MRKNCNFVTVVGLTNGERCLIKKLRVEKHWGSKKVLSFSRYQQPGKSIHNIRSPALRILLCRLESSAKERQKILKKYNEDSQSASQACSILLTVSD